VLATKDVELINVYKIKCVESALTTFEKLSKLFGTHVMQADLLKYEHLVLQKVAEGDTDVLRLSLIRSEFKKGLVYNFVFGGFSCYQL